MSYSIIQPPFTLKFREMTKKELTAYNDWFHNVMPERIQILTEAINTTASSQQWKPDCSQGSLEPLGVWFLTQVKMRPRTQEEISNIQAGSKLAIGVPNEELTNKTFSVAMDIGMYLSQVFLKAHPLLQWSQPLGNKKSVDYGQPVLVSFGAAPFNPVRMMVTLAYGMANQSRGGKSLCEIYEIWSRLASAALA